MKQFSQKQEIPDFQIIKLDKFLSEESVSALFDCGFDDMDGDTLKSKFKEFFKTHKEANFEKRLKNANNLFNN